MSKRLAYPVALAACLGLFASNAFAQTDARAQAKAEFKAGQKAFDAKDYAEALTHFRKAFEQHRHDAVRFNIAVCLERTARNREAMIEYESAAKSDQLDGAARARATKLAAEARARLGTLVVEGKPSGADVSIDGAVLCNVPCTIELDPTRHDVTVSSGALSDRRSVEIVRQETRRITVELGGAPESAEPRSVTPVVSPEPMRVEGERATSGGGPGWLTWTGAGLVVVGGAGIAVFGLQAKSNHDDWVASGDPSARDDGVRARNLTNVSIGVAVVGAVVAGVDLVLLAPKRGRSTSATRAKRPALGFSF